MGLLGRVAAAFMPARRASMLLAQSNATPLQHQRLCTPEPKSIITQIQCDLERVCQTLELAVNSFLYTISPSYAPPPVSTYSAPSPTQAPPALSPHHLPTPEQEHNHLFELLLQALLWLDAITSNGSWETARANRRRG